jgi:hypothetical protein
MTHRAYQYIKTGSDETYTPKYAVEPLKKHLINKYYSEKYTPIIWCPFDKQESNFVTMLRDWGYEVIASHIEDGQDFYNYKPNVFDIIISNPPFSNKKGIVERTLSFGVPFALLLPLNWLNDRAPFTLFEGKQLQLLTFDRRIKYIGKVNMQPSFASCYYCYKFLGHDLIMEKLPEIQMADLL